MALQILLTVTVAKNNSSLNIKQTFDAPINFPMQLPDTTDQNTRERLLETAERLFSDRGFASVSLRTLTKEAGVNLASVSYHFGSKEALINAIVHGHLVPVNEDRNARMDELEKKEKVTVREVLDAFMRPPFDRASQQKLPFAQHCRLLFRCMNEQTWEMPDEDRDRIRATVGRFSKMLHGLLPDITDEQLFLRLTFSIGTMLHTLMNSHLTAKVRLMPGPPPDQEEVYQAMLDYATHGFTGGTLTAEAGR